MRLLLQRTELTSLSTVGELAIDGEDFSYTLELPVRDGLPGSAIPAGVYPVVAAWSPRFMASDDPWVLKYAKQMPHIVGIPYRSLIMLHWGDVPENTDGCVLLGYTHPAPNLIEESRPAFAMFWNRWQYAMAHDSPAILTVRDVVPLEESTAT